MNQTPNVTIRHGAEHAAAIPPVSSDAAPLQNGKIRDARGRMIEVKPLNALEIYRLMKITKATGAEGFFGMAVMVCSVRSIDGEPEAFINSDRDIESMIQSLGNDGLAAVSEALTEYKEEIGEAPKR
jgi:hypothetical protein